MVEAESFRFRGMIGLDRVGMELASQALSRSESGATAPWVRA